jgi:hypothetical protein
MFSVLLTLVMGGLAAQQPLQQMSPRPLKSSHSAVLPVPSFGAYGPAQCDENLAIYYHLATGLPSRTELLRISQSGNESTLYKLPEEFANSTDFLDFSVTPGGDVKVLVEDRNYHAIVFAFDSEGKVSSHAQLEVPEHVAGRHIAAYSDGTVLYSGVYTNDAAAEVAGTTYVALFQPSGKLLKRLDRLRDKKKEDEQESVHFSEGAATLGRDGNIYLLTAERVLVISAEGTIQKELAFTKPSPEFSAVTLQYSEGWVAITFAKPERPEVVTRYLVLNASDGAPVGLYEPSEDTGNDNVCFSRHDGFLFTTFEHGRVKLITAPLR